MVTLDEALTDAVKRDWRSAELTPRERAMLAYAEKLTREPSSIWKDDLHALRAWGFDDRGILQVNRIASWVNYINRGADGLGVGRGE